MTRPPVAEAIEGPTITVLICTRNRAAQLASMLTSVTELDVPTGLSWELLVVDNGSSDDTRQVAESFADRLPIRVLEEPTPGLSNARNRGVEAARGDYICWTDDDVVLDPKWLAAYAAAFQLHPEAAIFGGRITPALDLPSPSWFSRLADSWPLTTVLAERDFGPVSIPLDPADGVAPWGANYAVRTEEQRRVRYEPTLGVSPHQRRLGEEAEAMHQMFAQGATGWWVPDAQVSHIIPAKRQTVRYIFSYFRAYGETVAHLEAIRPGAHHLSFNLREVRRTQGSGFKLRALSLMHKAVFAGLWVTGLSRRALTALMRAGFYAGAADLASEMRAPSGRSPKAPLASPETPRPHA